MSGQNGERRVLKIQLFFVLQQHNNTKNIIFFETQTLTRVLSCGGCFFRQIKIVRKKMTGKVKGRDEKIY